jgi:putative methyltransferase (TIGR04325 family)
MLEQNSWEGRQQVIFPYDYPVLFWLNSIFAAGDTSVFDFGGNVGIHFYSYSQYLQYPPQLKWTVCDFPTIVEEGLRIAEQRSVQSLHFTNDFKNVAQYEIMLASGSIQYVESLADMVSSVQMPKHLLINRLPLHEDIQFVTLQNGGKVFYPQYVFKKSKFIRELNNIGYELIDLWDDLITSCHIPFHPDKSVPCYKGLYLKLGN